MTQPAPLGSLLRRVSVAGAWTLAARVLLAGTGFTINLLLARSMTPEDFGIYFLAISVVSVLTMVAQMGLQVSVVRFAAEDHAGQSGGDAGALTFRFVTIGSAGAMLVGALYVSTAYEWVEGLLKAPALTDHARILALWVVVATPLGILAEAFRGSMQYRPAALFGGLSSAIILLFCVTPAFAAGQRMELGMLLNLCVGASISSLLMALFHALASRTGRRSQSDLPPVAAIMHVSLPLMLMSLATLVTTQADLWVAGAYLPKAEVAAYGVAARLVQVVLMPLLVLNAVLAPLIAQLHAQSQDRGGRARFEQLLGASSALGSMPGLLVLTLFLLLAEPILGGLYGESYAYAHVCLVLLSAGQWVNTCCGPAATVLMMCGRERAVMGVSLLGGLITLLGGMLLAPAFGMEGIAAAAAIGSGAHGLLCMLWVRRTLGIWTYPNFSNLRAAMASGWSSLLKRSP